MIMTTVMTIAAIWFTLNLAIPAFILWQRSPHFRHRVFGLALGAFAPSKRKRFRQRFVVESRLVRPLRSLR
jgi:hypothetical protein